MPENHARALFLHGGPGLCTAMEQVWFRDRLPVIWWDQPRTSAQQRITFDNLVEAAIDRLDEEHRRSSARVPIIAHSFGGQLAAAMARRIPERIASLTLLTCPPDLPISFERIAMRFAAISPDSPLREPMLTYQRSKTIDALWPLIGAVFAVPHFIDSLWGPDSGPIRDQLRWITQKDSFIDATTFQQGMDDFLRREKPGSVVLFSGRVHIISGIHDKYADPEVDFSVWLKQFPAAVSSTYPIGHFPQLELPDDRWMPMRNLKNDTQ